MDACTENYECLGLDNTVKSQQNSGLCILVQGNSSGKTSGLVRPDLWRLHKKMYNPKHLHQEGRGCQEGDEENQAQDYEKEIGASVDTSRKQYDYNNMASDQVIHYEPFR